MCKIILFSFPWKVNKGKEKAKDEYDTSSDDDSIGSKEQIGNSTMIFAIFSKELYLNLIFYFDMDIVLKQTNRQEGEISSDQQHMTPDNILLFRLFEHYYSLKCRSSCTDFFLKFKIDRTSEDRSSVRGIREGHAENRKNPGKVHRADKPRKCLETYLQI